MHHVLRTLALVAATGLTAGHASAQLACPSGSTRVTGTALQTLIGNKTICAASSSNSDTWQEFHQGLSSGPLIDWKQGPNHPVDPTSVVGTWSLPNDTLTHSYGALSYSWWVCQTATSITLVSTGVSSTITGATLKSGSVSCP
jgi:hypothetical protein